MASSNSSSDEDSFQVGFWNNWLPSSVHTNLQTTSGCSSQLKRAKEGVFHSKTPFFTDDPKFGNWIPPDSLLSNSLKPTQNTTLRKKTSRHAEKGNLLSQNGSIAVIEDVAEVLGKFPGNTVAWKKELNLIWGERTRLHDVTTFNDGDVTWGFVNLGVFANIRLWVNEYGNVCGFADGKISSLDSSEVTFITINSTQLLRKMLSLSSVQWASLCETVKETKTILKFDAFEVSDWTKKSSLEKLWFFICRRRHVLPNQCMLVKLCGAVKCLRKFKITTKLIVQDIKNFTGRPILD